GFYGTWSLARLNDERFESWRTCEKHAGVLTDLLIGVHGLGELMPGKFLQTDFAMDGHENVGHQRNERLISADVRCSLFTPNVLFTGGECENKTAFAAAIRGLADQASGHLANIGFARGNHAAVRTAECERHAERLRFHGDNV